MRHWNNGTDHRHSKSCCDKSSPARRTIMLLFLYHPCWFIIIVCNDLSPIQLQVITCTNYGFSFRTQGSNSVKFESQYKHFLFKKAHFKMFPAKCHLSHFVTSSVWWSVPCVSPGGGNSRHLMKCSWHTWAILTSARVSKFYRVICYWHHWSFILCHRWPIYAKKNNTWNLIQENFMKFLV